MEEKETGEKKREIEVKEKEIGEKKKEIEVGEKETGEKLSVESSKSQQNEEREEGRQKSYSGYSVLRLTPKSSDQLNFLKRLAVNDSKVRFLRFLSLFSFSHSGIRRKI